MLQRLGIGFTPIDLPILCEASITGSLCTASSEQIFNNRVVERREDRTSYLSLEPRLVGNCKSRRPGTSISVFLRTVSPDLKHLDMVSPCLSHVLNRAKFAQFTQSAE